MDAEKEGTVIRSRLALSAVAAAMLAAAACTDDAPGDSSLESPTSNTRQTEPNGPPDSNGGAAQDEDPLANFQLDVVRAEAEGLLGKSESELELSRMLRIVRRGEDRLPTTMDLRPGRLNVELDNHAGNFVVTRVVVETPDGNVVVD